MKSDDYCCQKTRIVVTKLSNMSSAVEVDREERETTMRLIRLVTHQPALWDNSCPQYRDKAYKKVVITELAKQMDWTEDAVIKKFANLRTYYTKELNKELLSQVRCKVTGLASEVYRSKWPYYNVLDRFLRMQVRTAKKIHSQMENASSPSIMRVNLDTESIEHILEESDEKLESEDGYHDNGHHEDWEDDPVPRKLIKQEPSSPCGSELSINEVTNQVPPSLLHALPTHLAPPPQLVMSGSESHDEIFGKLICEQLKRVREGKKKELLKIKIQQLIVDTLFDE